MGEVSWEPKRKRSLASQYSILSSDKDLTFEISIGELFKGDTYTAEKLSLENIATLSLLKIKLCEREEVWRIQMLFPFPSSLIKYEILGTSKQSPD